ncbi:T9SS type A sorting domain-containing protein [Dyadobacter sp. CY261]|uniref:DUF7850 domain-containing protein n=1 Tax=Dyadobacter sp. CY261 TaxID=2907203 RepID=UPI001F271964|nr:T9SS type A sorting domain-containing protein [Dyadobacter sp. CY261]MCF0073330.1 T9SS type A sorting domain-containing protein [Dyadobacter sp. CY261]
MKNFTFLFTLLLLSLGFAFQASATGSDCGCDGNKLTNPSFETAHQGSTAGWTKLNNDTPFTTDNKYNMCGEYNGLLGDGTKKDAAIWQEFALTAGSQVDLKVYGGTHNNEYKHQFKLIFYNSSDVQISEEVVTMNYEVGNGSSLQKYTKSAVAPANAVKVRFEIFSSGNYFKIDGACLIITPPVDCNCVNSTTLIKNASFENSNFGDWSVVSINNLKFTQDDAYEMCGSHNGLLQNKGYIYQDVALVAGSQVQVSAYGGTHDKNEVHNFKLTFIDGAGNSVGEVVTDMDYQVTDSKLKQFFVSGAAPAGSVKVRFSVYSGGNWFKVDAICLTVTQPVTCQECTGNKLVNHSFENGTDNWNATGSLSVDQKYAVCGEKGAKLDGQGKFWQDVEVLTTYGTQVTLTIFGAFSSANSQKFQLLFLDEMQTEIGSATTDVTKLITTNPWGLVKYTVTGTFPPKTKYVRVIGSSNGGNFFADNACLTFSGPPLPVTLSSFSAKKEGGTAQLAWTTTSESNSAYFEIQHSQDGKSWIALDRLEAKGESKDLETYTYTHTNPFAVNLYRLKMVDLDETFAFSMIKSLSFDGQEQMNVYPNPTVDRIKLSSNQQITNVKVFSQTGALVLNTVPDSASEVDLTKLAQGTYYVKINNGPLMRKILVVR